MAERIPPFELHILESICKTIAQTEGGLTGREISKFLNDLRIQDITPASNKWERLYNALRNWQNINNCSNKILLFVKAALQPARYIGKMELFENRRIETNKRLSFIGYELLEDGTFSIINKSTTIKEAEEKANKLKHKLEYSNAHKLIFKYCSSELLVENYFHTVFEATKSIGDRIREITGLNTDGNTLVEKAFAIETPLIQINDLIDQSDRSEHIGLSNIIKGLFGYIRNPTAHIPKIKFTINEEQAIDLLIIVSFVHKSLDKCK